MVDFIWLQRGGNAPLVFMVPEGLYVYIISGNYSDAVKGLQRIDKSGTLLLIDGGK